MVAFNHMITSLALCAAALYSRMSRAETTASSDVSILSGFALGTVSKTLNDGSSQTFRIGGVPLGFSRNFDISYNWSTALGGQILLDIINRQMIRQGFTGSCSYHLLGGPRRLDGLGESIRVTSTNSYNLSLVGRAALFNYGASDPKSPGTNLAGGVWEIASGLEYRKEISDSSATGAMIMLSMTTLPASVERLASKTNELLFFWRHFW